MASKVLWIVNLHNIPHFLNQAREVGATAVAVRTTADNFHDSIPAFHDAGIRILGWRFPPVIRSKALDQAQHVVELMELGLDGFIVDPEGHESPNLNWDQHGLEDLAGDYCRIIRSSFPDRLFGTSSDHRAARVYPKLPWSVFIGSSDRVYPQAYWRMETEHGPRPVGKGKPAPNYEVALNAWREAGADAGTIIPMAGEIALATAAEIAAYGAAAVTHGIDELHFYTADGAVPDTVLQAISLL
jgi:hypothetical protein